MRALHLHARSGAIQESSFSTIHPHLEVGSVFGLRGTLYRVTVFDKQIPNEAIQAEEVPELVTSLTPQLQEQICCPHCLTQVDDTIPLTMQDSVEDCTTCQGLLHVHRYFNCQVGDEIKPVYYVNIPLRPPHVLFSID